MLWKALYFHIITVGFMKSASCGQKKLIAMFPTALEGITTPPPPPALEVIRGRWTSPATPLQPLPTPGGPFTLKSIQSSIHSAEIRMRATFSLIQRSSHELKWRQRGRASGATPDLENHLWGPTFVRRVDLGRGGSNSCRDKEASLTSCVPWLSAECNNCESFLIFGLIFATLLHSLQLFSKVNFAQSLRASASQLIHSSCLPAGGGWAFFVCLFIFLFLCERIVMVGG